MSIEKKTLDSFLKNPDFGDVGECLLTFFLSQCFLSLVLVSDVGET